MRRVLGILVGLLVLVICFPSFAAGSNSNIGKAALYLAEKLPHPEIGLEAQRIAFLAFMSEEPERSWTIWDRTLRKNLMDAIYTELDEKEKKLYKQLEKEAYQLADQLFAAILLAGTQYPERVKGLVKLLPKDPDKFELQLQEQKLEGVFKKLEEEEKPETVRGAFFTLLEMFMGSAWLNLDPQTAKLFFSRSLINAQAMGEPIAEYALMTPIFCLAKMSAWEDVSLFCSQRMSQIIAQVPEEERQDFKVIQDLTEYTAELYCLGATSVTSITNIESPMGGGQHIMAKLEKKPENVEAVRQFSKEILELAASPKSEYKSAALLGVALLGAYEMFEQAKEVIERVLTTADEEEKEEIMPAAISLAQHINEDLFLRLLKEYIQLELSQADLFHNPNEAVRAILFVIASSMEPEKPLNRETLLWIEGEIEKYVELPGDQAALLQLLSQLADRVERTRLNQKVERIWQELVQDPDVAGRLAGVLLVQTAPFDSDKSRQLIDVFVEQTNKWTDEERIGATYEILHTFNKSLGGVSGTSFLWLEM